MNAVVDTGNLTAEQRDSLKKLTSIFPYAGQDLQPGDSTDNKWEL